LTLSVGAGVLVGVKSLSEIMNYYFRLVLKSFKLGLAFNFFTLILIVFYTLAVEYYFRPFQVAFNPLVEFGTAVSGMKIFSGPDPKNHSFRPAWAKIEFQFGLFIPSFSCGQIGRTIASA
jgi:hypothetical protein